MCHEPTPFERIRETAGEKERWQAQGEEVIDS
jgi:hypothetical protein